MITPLELRNYFAENYLPLLQRIPEASVEEAATKDGFVFIINLQLGDSPLDWFTKGLICFSGRKVLILGSEPWEMKEEPDESDWKKLSVELNDVVSRVLTTVVNYHLTGETFDGYIHLKEKDIVVGLRYIDGNIYILWWDAKSGKNNHLVMPFCEDYENVPKLIEKIISKTFQL